MVAADSFSQYYNPLLDDSYDVVDRIVLNGYFPLGSSPGGFRTWWRQLHDGGDENLDKTHLMRMAGRFSRRLRGWAKKHDIPVIYCAAGTRKREIAEEHKPTDADFNGIFCVLVGRAQAPVWEVQHQSNGGINLRRKKPMPWVNHYHFHIVDEEWGHITIKICGHPPFPAQLMLNGHEYVACWAREVGIEFAKEANCFTEVSSATDLAKIADALRSRTAVERLSEVCERWIYFCVCFGLPFDEQKKSGFFYAFSVYQAEYSRNLLFKRGAEMDQVFNGVIDRTRALLDIHRVKTLFGYKHRPKRRKKKPRFEAVVERPVYDLTVFKVHFGRQTLKMYTKGERVLRIEAVTHNTAELRCGKVLERFPVIIERLAAMLEHFLEALCCVDVGFLTDTTLDDLPKSTWVGSVRVGGVDLNLARMRAVMEAVIALAPFPKGFSSRQLADKVGEITGQPYTPRQAAYDLKKLRGKHFVTLAGRMYSPTSPGLRTMTALLTLRDKIIKPVLAGAGRPRRGPPPKNRAPIDEHYDRIQKQMRGLFEELCIGCGHSADG